MLLERRLTRAGRFRAPAAWLDRFYAALASREASPVDIVCLGDSVTEGQQASTVDARWIEQLADNLRLRYRQPGDVGRYYPMVFGVTFTNPANPITLSGSGGSTNVAWGLGLRSLNMFAATHASLTFVGTGFRIFYVKGSTLGTFTYTLDGGAPVSVVTTDAVLLGGQVVNVTGLSFTSHTLVIDVTSSPAGCVIEGIAIEHGTETSGIRVWDAGHGGYRTNHYTDATLHWLETIDTIQPALVTICLGINDYSGGVNSAATVKANLQTIISRIRTHVAPDPSILLIAPYQAHVPSIVESWATYVTKIKEVADEDGGIGYLDLVPSFGGYIDPPGGGLIDADRVHPSDTGQTLIGSLVHAAIAY